MYNLNKMLKCITPTLTTLPFTQPTCTLNKKRNRNLLACYASPPVLVNTYGGWKPASHPCVFTPYRPAVHYTKHEGQLQHVRHNVKLTLRKAPCPSTMCSVARLGIFLLIPWRSSVIHQPKSLFTLRITHPPTISSHCRKFHHSTIEIVIDGPLL